MTKRPEELKLTDKVVDAFLKTVGKSDPERTKRIRQRFNEKQNEKNGKQK